MKRIWAITCVFQRALNIEVCNAFIAADTEAAAWTEAWDHFATCFPLSQGWRLAMAKREAISESVIDAVRPYRN